MAKLHHGVLKVARTGLENHMLLWFGNKLHDPGALRKLPRHLQLCIGGWRLHREVEGLVTAAETCLRSDAFFAGPTNQLFVGVPES